MSLERPLRHWYFGEVRHGHVPSPEDLNQVCGEQLEQATNVWRKRREPH